MTDLATLTLDTLKGAVAHTGVAIRSVTRLQPAGGRGDKVFPPTYATGNNTLRYAMEKRRANGETIDVVLLDSVASQANRFEESLLAGWEQRALHFPVIGIDFTDEPSLANIGRLTALETPHRIADALFRDSEDESGTSFRKTEVGRAYTEADVRNATALYQYCPTALVFGVWDSTGPKGGLGNKFQRALVSEIVGYGAITGKKTASRIDPLAIQANVPVYHRADDHSDWTIDEAEAEKKKKRPVPFSRKGAEGKGKPSAVNHSNVAPTIDEYAGGVTFDYAEQTTVLSLPALRRLRFPTDVTGRRLDGETRADAENAARTALAALALAAVAWLRARGYDLRSRSFLVPDPGGPLTLEVLPLDGGTPTKYALTPEDAATLLGQAHDEAKALGFGWKRDPLTLKPAKKLVGLIKKSRELAAEAAPDAAEG